MTKAHTGGMNRYNGQGPGNGYRVSNLGRCGTLGTSVLNNTTAAPLRPKRTGGGHQEHDGNMAAYTANAQDTRKGRRLSTTKSQLRRAGGLLLAAALFVSGLAGEG